MLSERHMEPGGLLPRDFGAETLAMTDEIHLMDWLMPLSGEMELEGISENWGPFKADLHPEFRFVTSVYVGARGPWRQHLQLTSWSVVPQEEELFDASDLDPLRIARYFDSPV
jgi:hypothetical protein